MPSLQTALHTHVTHKNHSFPELAQPRKPFAAAQKRPPTNLAQYLTIWVNIFGEKEQRSLYDSQAFL